MPKLKCAKQKFKCTKTLTSLTSARCRAQRHAEIMKMAEFRRQLGIPAQDILEYIDKATRELDYDAN
ncbi:hypothetical protein ACHHYP_20227 [Achlya hypogyna]|uniref:Uncharacterized protein n=1 Tax=Achlya hypogyna TaxID=1202772 RepID=A0A1V9YX24_ACHHY|nr:hypothetical protein ACHHYP_20227 [Achlya hypogyna]